MENMRQEYTFYINNNKSEGIFKFPFKKKKKERKATENIPKKN